MEEKILEAVANGYYSRRINKTSGKVTWTAKGYPTLDNLEYQETKNKIADIRMAMYDRLCK